jgi:hypothetical protein
MMRIHPTRIVAFGLEPGQQAVSARSITD